ncbi:MAG: glycosyltransferase family 4 protein [Terrisporobacter sp.]
MRILHITGQKPNSTGSGVYISGLIDNLRNLGHSQCVIAGMDIKDERKCFEKEIKCYPLMYNSDKIPFSVLGMSDIMPYESTKYKDLNKEMMQALKKEFISLLKKVIDEFKPDIIISNHLYLITAFVVESVKDIKVIGLCHGTCLRQLKNIDLEKEYIISNIRKLDKIFVLQEAQREDVINLFNLKEEKVIVIGSGYDNDIFYFKNYKKSNNVINITFAGKVCKSKGLKSLLLSLNKLKYPNKSIVLNIAGSGSDYVIYEEMLQISEECKYKVNFLGRLNHEDLSELFNKSQLFILPSFYEGLPVVVLEALACGCEVIVSDISGVKKWMGNKINKSGNIDYIKLPNMKSAGVPIKSELNEFEEELYYTIDKKINKIFTKGCNDIVNMEDKTWLGLAKRVDEIIDNII